MKLAAALALAALGCAACTGQSHQTASTGHAPSVSPSSTPSLSVAPSPSAGQPRDGCVPAHMLHPTGAVLSMQYVGSSVWAVGDAGIWSSPDGGQHWDRRRSGGHFERVDFVDAGHGWAVGRRHVLATRDGGRSWVALADSRCRPIDAVHFVTPILGFAVAGVDPEGGNGGWLLETQNGGRSWRHLSAPREVESVCFQDRFTGWLGTEYGIFASRDGGHSWHRLVGAPGGFRRIRPIVEVQCAGGDVAWALARAFGGVMSQSPHIGWRLTLTSGTPLFAEQYFPHPAVRVKAEAASSYPGPFSVVDPSQAVFIDNCPACGAGTSPWLLASAAGGLDRHAGVPYLTESTAGSFASTSNGCVGGNYRRVRNNHVDRNIARIVCTHDGGAHWLVTWQRPAPA